MSRGPGGVVAELGRPETEEETAARKAENRRRHRAAQTTRNLVASLGACLVLVVAIVAFAPRGADPTATPSVDVGRVAASGLGSEPAPLLVPSVPASWTPNAAEMRGSGDVAAWYVGYVLPAQAFAAFSQGFDANPTWLAATLDQAKATGSRTLAGQRWTVYDRRSLGTGAGNVAYALTTTIGRSTLAVYGTASTADLDRLAGALVAASREHAGSAATGAAG